MFVFPFPLILFLEFIERFHCITKVLDESLIKFTNLKKLFTFFTLVEVFYSLTALILLFSIWTSPLLIITPRMSIFSVLKLHFDHLKQRLCFSAIFKNQIVCFSSSFLILVGITKLSIYFVNTPSYNNSLKILFIILWNNSVFHSSSSLIFY